jgi:hypothetical protein
MKVLISFSGLAQSSLGIPPAEFSNFVKKHFPEILLFNFSDSYKQWYHNGMDIWLNDTWKRISNNIDESLHYLLEIIRDYNEVYVIGTSSGGYASILFSHLINTALKSQKVKKVLTYVPQTNLKSPFHSIIEQGLNRAKFDTRYLDLSLLNLGHLNITVHADQRYTDECDVHHISQCMNIQGFPNVVIVVHSILNLKVRRDSGDLYNDFISLLD